MIQKQALPIAILAGGLGTRLRPITEKIPKSMVEIAGRPFLEYQIELLQAHGITDIVLCVGYRAELIEEYFGDGRRWGVTIAYSNDGDTALGTAGALKRALPYLGSRFLVLYGDSYLEIDYQAVAGAFLQSAKLGLMTVFANQGQWDRSNVWFHNGQIKVYDKKVQLPEMQHIDYGLGVLDAKAFEDVPGASFFDLAQLYVQLVERDELAGYEATQRFYEVGSPCGLDEFEQLVARGESVST